MMKEFLASVDPSRLSGNWFEDDALFQEAREFILAKCREDIASSRPQCFLKTETR